MGLLCQHCFQVVASYGSDNPFRVNLIYRQSKVNVSKSALLGRKLGSGSLVEKQNLGQVHWLRSMYGCDPRHMPLHFNQSDIHYSCESPSANLIKIC